MSSPSAPPSTATSSSLSRVESITTMEYLQNSAHGHGHRSLSSEGNGDASANTSESNSANQKQQTQQQEAKGSSATADTSKTTSTAAGTGATESSATTTTTKSSEQGRNSTKRAAQNRAAQRAFRQRKDMYVRDLERKAELLVQAESKIMHLTARNRELEALFAAQQQVNSASPMHSPLPQDPSANGYISKAGLVDREREWDRERERDWARERERLHEIGGGPYDHFHGTSPAPSSVRPTLGRHSSAQHLRQAYNSSSPPLASDAIKHLSLNSKLSTHFQHQRPDSDHEVEMQSRPSRHLHRHPSESSLNLRAGFFGQSIAEAKDDDIPGMPRLHSFRGGPIDSRSTDKASPSSSHSNKSPMSGPLGPVPTASHDTSIHHYPSSPLTPTHERMPLYPSGQNPRSASSAGVNSSPTGGTGSHGECPPAYDPNAKRTSDGTISNWMGSDLYRVPQDPHPHPHPYLHHNSVRKQASWSSLSEQRRHHSVKKQPSWGSISEHRQNWRTMTESPEIGSESRFGGGSGGGAQAVAAAAPPPPALPRIPSQFSQRPPPPQQQHSFDREYPSSPATSFPYSPTSAHSQQQPQSQPPHHGRQPSDYYNTQRAPPPPPPHDNGHGPSDMEIVQETKGGYDADVYEMERDERFNAREDLGKSNMGMAMNIGSPH
ncbi:hypothetical protein BGZ50_009378 [Haplosporangium sp. Z 11]|nr:hypothetical protein BGZ50_009378 [Haplosporangium sp. Z 11]